MSDHQYVLTCRKGEEFSQTCFEKSTNGLRIAKIRFNHAVAQAQHSDDWDYVSLVESAGSDFFPLGEWMALLPSPPLQAVTGSQVAKTSPCEVERSSGGFRVGEMGGRP